jgi:hypothetical protein
LKNIQILKNNRKEKREDCACYWAGLGKTMKGNMPMLEGAYNKEKPIQKGSSYPLLDA